MNLIIMAIESSCDETSVAIIHNKKILSNIINSQKIHKNYGGVIPELASRNHQKIIISIINKALKNAKIKLNQLNAIAFTRGPGLLGSLLIGASFAKSISLSLKIPLISINHIHAHILSNFINKPKPKFPFLCCIVSGGHTQIIIIRNYLCANKIGETKDDAIGEAIDKISKLININYPGGAILDIYAKYGNKNKFKFPITIVPRLNFSFSGIKTAFLYFLKKNKKKNKNFIKKNKFNICASIQESIIETLINKLKKAIKQTNIKYITIGGGVASNSRLKNKLTKLSGNKIKIFIPNSQYCIDNAGMIAITAYYKYLNNKFSNLKTCIVPKNL